MSLEGARERRMGRALLAIALATATATTALGVGQAGPRPAARAMTDDAAVSRWKDAASTDAPTANRRIGSARIYSTETPSEPTDSSGPAPTTRSTAPAETERVPGELLGSQSEFGPTTLHTRVSNLVAGGALTVAEGRRAIQAVESRWAECLRSAPSVDGGSPPKDLGIHVVVDATGHVSRVLVDDALAPPQTAACLADPLRGIPIGAGGGSLDMRVLMAIDPARSVGRRTRSR